MSCVAQANRAPSNGAGPGWENQDRSQQLRQEATSRERAGWGNGGRGTSNGGGEVPAASRAAPIRLETSPDATERPARRGHRGAPLVPAGCGG